jgi:hypothetical protein
MVYVLGVRILISFCSDRYFGPGQLRGYCMVAAMGSRKARSG